MAYLKDKFTIQDTKEINERINRIFNQVTHANTTTTVGVTELQLLGIIDHLCRVSGMLCDMVEQQLEGHIETFDPHSYIDKKLKNAEIGISNFIKIKKINVT
ncbi:hypothetical protein [Neobacillus cucumis]|uniref:hypothetical protein n=1 Tax=Neobacillus cucumis TaxID=1740721 RepID=UPI001965B28C|nr:hypothetical protein [Neobacillus cucumis]MBM7654173.1 hypothetical protein [Neobacillus cucumis]MDR4946186.1 hypothetical protein [Neobacillus cucumis]MED4229136.1 hypothetical protein [Neobacillus cucumis]